MENANLFESCSKVIQPMGSLQPGSPLPSLLPKAWPSIVIDLQDYFFTIPLQEKDREKISFTVFIIIPACKEISMEIIP